jgi:hypothetical protein
MPGEPFLRVPTRGKKVFDILSQNEADRSWEVFPEACRQFQHLLRARRISSIPEDELSDIQFEGAAKAVRKAKNGRLTAAFMSNSMRFELGRHWRKPETRATEVEIPDIHSGAGAGVAAVAKDAVSDGPTVNHQPKLKSFPIETRRTIGSLCLGIWIRVSQPLYTTGMSIEPGAYNPT